MPVRKTRMRKTYRRKSHIKIKTTRRHRKGGRAIPPNNRINVNMGNMRVVHMSNGNGNGNENENMGNGNGNVNENMENNGGIGDFINKLQDIMEEVNTNQDKDVFINRLLELLSEARDIDNNMPGAGMEQHVIQKIADILIKYDPNLEERNYNTVLLNVRRNYIPNN